jgi:hypothetical protein
MYSCIGALSTNILLSVPPPLIKNFDLMELFASPINHTSKHYCSCFEIDKKLNSYGSFFDYKFEKNGRYLANPPFDETLMEKMSDRVIEQCKKTNIDLIVITLPVWDSISQVSIGGVDSKTRFIAFEKLTNEAFPNYFVEKKILLKPKHKYYNYMSSKYTIATNTHLIVISSKGNKIEEIANYWLNLSLN